MIRLENVLKTSWRCFEDIFARRLKDVSKTPWKRFSKTSWRCLEDALKTSWKHFENVLARRLEDVLKMSWKRLEDVLKTYDEDGYIGLDQEVLKTSWRRFLKTKTKDVFKTSPSRRMFAVMEFFLTWQEIRAKKENISSFSLAKSKYV